MKVTTEHFNAMFAAIKPFNTESRREDYRLGQFPRAELVKDLDKRYRWDLFWMSGAETVVRDVGYADAHIDTALRKIVAPLIKS